MDRLDRAHGVEPRVAQAVGQVVGILHMVGGIEVVVGDLVFRVKGRPLEPQGVVDREPPVQDEPPFDYEFPHDRKGPLGQGSVGIPNLADCLELCCPGVDPPPHFLKRVF